ncbi:uncharacterized protein B0H18DRAFT_1033154 [Fomitopsis serialis]|uniref:uncharacterized protein n=1 Tax=Fomitopsis serialis TaxID=139415 RepID=UPI0020077580|nr:uncharacterized protein B0H18DRAFT_1033154 [Neoantrodia serialis]KAH9917813.1 hypothetical protein B0H18DRAFT_1033154 [Neoantrodia serialis]
MAAAGMHDAEADELAGECQTASASLGVHLTVFDMLVLEALAAPLRAIHRRLTYFYRFLLILALSRIYAVSVAHLLGLVNLRRLCLDPTYTVPLKHVLAPELHGTSAIIWMAAVWDITILSLRVAWVYRTQDGDVALRVSNLASEWQRTLGLVCRYALAGGIVAVAAHCLVLCGQCKASDIPTAIFATWILATYVVWPVMKVVMGTREAPVASMDSVMRWTLDDLVGALPVLRPRNVPHEDDCAICFQSLQEIRSEARAIVKLPQCGHVFCKACISEWMHMGGSSCPMCLNCFPDDLRAICEHRRSAPVMFFLEAAASFISAWLWALFDGLAAFLGLLMSCCHRIVMLVRRLTMFFRRLTTFFWRLTMWFFPCLPVFFGTLAALWAETARVPQGSDWFLNGQRSDRIFDDRQHQHDTPFHPSEACDKRFEELLAMMQQHAAIRSDDIARQDRVIQCLERLQVALSVDRLAHATAEVRAPPAFDV